MTTKHDGRRLWNAAAAAANGKSQLAELSLPLDFMQIQRPTPQPRRAPPTYPNRCFTRHCQFSSSARGIRQPTRAGGTLIVLARNHRARFMGRGVASRASAHTIIPTDPHPHPRQAAGSRAPSFPNYSIILNIPGYQLSAPTQELGRQLRKPAPNAHLSAPNF